MRHESSVKVRICETDGLGHVSNISYFIYLEEARVELFRELGVPMGRKGWPYILASTACDFKQQAYFDDRLTIQTAVSNIGNSSFQISHHIIGERGLIATGKAAVVHFDFDKQTSSPLPAEVRSKLEEYLQREEIREW